MAFGYNETNMPGSYYSMWAELRSSKKSQRRYFQSQDVTIHTSVRGCVVVVVVLVVVVLVLVVV